MDRAARRGRRARDLRPAAGGRYFDARDPAALVLAEFRAPYRGRSTPVNAWWGSFDLGVNLFSGTPADPPSDDFIMRNSMDAQEVAVGWWPGDRATAARRSTLRAPRSGGVLGGASRRTPLGAEMGLFVLDWDDASAAADPHAAALGSPARPSTTPAWSAIGTRSAGQRRGQPAAVHNPARASPRRPRSRSGDPGSSSRRGAGQPSAPGAPLEAVTPVEANRPVRRCPGADQQGPRGRRRQLLHQSAAHAASLAAGPHIRVADQVDLAQPLDPHDAHELAVVLVAPELHAGGELVVELLHGM